MSVYIYKRRGSTLVNQLAHNLGIRCVTDTKGPRNVRTSRMICWGNSSIPNWAVGDHPQWILGNPRSVATMAHKIRCFQQLSHAGLPTLLFTSDKQVAQTWMNEGYMVYARTILTGHSGEGLYLCQPSLGDTLPDAPLYTRDYRTPFKEYRIHIVMGDVIDRTMKRRMSDGSMAEHGFRNIDGRERLQVRTYENGWVFARDDMLWDESLGRTAAQAVAACGSNIGAVDMIAKWENDRLRDHAIIEINSAPALRSETTLRAYTNALRPLIN